MTRLGYDAILAPVIRQNLILEISKHRSLFATRWESVTHLPVSILGSG
jgi:hypothetical protein